MEQVILNHDAQKIIVQICIKALHRAQQDDADHGDKLQHSNSYFANGQDK